ncbi:MAG: DinB family protein, partial [Bacteroidota bacterium]
MQSEIQALAKRIKQVSEDAKASFVGLSIEQLNWKGNPQSWSIAQCLDHLMTTNELYLPIFAAIDTDTVPHNFFSRFRILSGYFGSLLRRTLGPEVVRKAKSPSNFQPSQSDLGGDVLARFLAHQERVLHAYTSLPEADLSQIIMISPAASFVT